ncbi:TPA: DUF192 domain-containing protein [Pseudomonas aeruginosa]|uniref:DUF192 domain-containing protein n=2 Tax=Pseudomonas aeruginosa TaxID=287 RepID=UPI0018732920|nr:DUF192 domain-containing protein [Pseudomonas aeruginosa]EKW1630444.1 DUF192 domain-containing protein [Pseudomonas aeruginosa]MCA6831460.1 DUF192 domain-containing protein [Pseudomonas aeruginosa]MCA6837430.1 DUF192 domain-containing protein [Pseudomonas aeruginosa]MCG0483908.1 DUF192 domain-containing protein [Pseudomonas aeruginosa]MCV3889980.1 DUF192 domain-containing protein [Pseudomonas aeruginosa]
MMFVRCLPALVLMGAATASAAPTMCQLSFDNGTTLDLPLAKTEAEQIQGLAGRHDPGPGMLFLWRLPSVRFVWMKNTAFPLEAAWFGVDGIVQSVQALVPGTTTKHSSLRPALGIIEVPHGELARRGIKRGSAIITSTCFNL